MFRLSRPDLAVKIDSRGLSNELAQKNTWPMKETPVRSLVLVAS